MNEHRPRPCAASPPPRPARPPAAGRTSCTWWTLCAAAWSSSPSSGPSSSCATHPVRSRVWMYVWPAGGLLQGSRQRVLQRGCRQAPRNCWAMPLHLLKPPHLPITARRDGRQGGAHPGQAHPLPPVLHHGARWWGRGVWFLSVGAVLRRRVPAPAAHPRVELQTNPPVELPPPPCTCPPRSPPAPAGGLLHLLHAHHRVPAGKHAALPLHLAGRRRLRGSHHHLLRRRRLVLQARGAAAAGAACRSACLAALRTCPSARTCCPPKLAPTLLPAVTPGVQAHARGRQPLLPADRGGGD